MKAVYRLPVKQGIVIPVSDETPLTSFCNLKVNWKVDSEGHLNSVELEILGAQIQHNPNGAILCSSPELEDFAFRVIAYIADSILFQTGVDAIDPNFVRHVTPCILPETPDEKEEFAKNPKRTVRNTFTVDAILRKEICPLDGKKIEVLARDFSRLNELYYMAFRFAIRESDPVSRYLFLYNILLQIHDDSQKNVDNFIRTENPQVQQSPRPDEPSIIETIFTRLRNEVGHARPNVIPANTRKEISENVAQLQSLVKKAIFSST